MNMFWLLLGGSVWRQIYFTWWWVVVGGRGWWWVVMGGGGWWWVMMSGGIVQSKPFSYFLMTFSTISFLEWLVSNSFKQFT